MASRIILIIMLSSQFLFLFSQSGHQLKNNDKSSTEHNDDISLDTIIRSLGEYFKDTDEEFIKYENKTLITRQRVSEKIFARNICSIKLKDVRYELTSKFDHVRWNVGLKISFYSGNGKVDGKDFSGISFNFPYITRVLNGESITLPNGTSYLTSSQRAADEATEYFVSDKNHPSKRFLRALKALIDKECPSDSLPFD